MLAGRLALWLALVLALGAGCGRGEPLAMRHAQQRSIWVERALGAINGSGNSTGSARTDQAAAAAKDARRTQTHNLDTPFYFDQLVDHRAGPSQGTFRQRFFINDNSYVPGGPVYLLNSGETPASPSYLTAGEPYTLAQATGGLLVIMEHRYYGESYPVGDMSGPSMRYLTVNNSLEDIAYFIRNGQAFVKGAVGTEIAAGAKWVVVGGSYSATLATWARKMYPDLVHAAYASSAPVLARADFYQYDQVVGRALPCAGSIAAAVDTLDRILDSRNRTLIDSWKRAFGLQGLAADADFAGALTDQMSFTVQYYMPPAPGSGAPDAIAQLCRWFDNARNIPLQNMADMTAAYIRDSGIDPVAAYSSGAGATNTALRQDGRAWFYQTCTEFGFWQSAPPAPYRRLRSKYVTAEWQSRPCAQFFGGGVTGRPDTDALNRQFGGFSPDVTRVVFVNGLHDPWSALSVSSTAQTAETTSEDGRNVVITMPLASHVADFYFAASRTDFGVDAARKSILAAMQRFLAQ